jgi:hypothetical protein
MSSIDSLCGALDEVTIARNVGIAHDEARAAYVLRKNTVSSFDEFNNLIADYYSYHIGLCVVQGGRTANFEAAGRASEILEREYRRQGGNLTSAYKDANDGTNGGMRIILDIIAEQLKEESVERYVRHAFNRHVDPTSWDQKVEIIRQFIDRNRHIPGFSVDAAHPERYAQNYEELIKAFVEALKKASNIFRKH